MRHVHPPDRGAFATDSRRHCYIGPHRVLSADREIIFKPLDVRNPERYTLQCRSYISRTASKVLLKIIYSPDSSFPRNAKIFYCSELGVNPVDGTLIYSMLLYLIERTHHRDITLLDLNKWCTKYLPFNFVIPVPFISAAQSSRDN